MNCFPFRFVMPVFIIVLLYRVVPFLQDRFVMTPPVVPSEAESTWADKMEISIGTHVDLPEGLSIPGFSSDSTQANIFLTTRRLRIVQRGSDGVLTLQVTYLPVSPTVVASIGTTSTDLGTFLQGKTFVINCGSNSVTNADASSSAVTDEETRLVKRECDDLARFNNLKGVIENMKVGEKKAFTSGAISLFTEEFDQFAIQRWELTLRTLNAGPPRGATFDVRARTASDAKKTFSIFEGELVIDEQGLNIELILKSSSAPTSQTLPDGKTKISSRSSLQLKFNRQVVLPTLPPVTP